MSYNDRGLPQNPAQIEAMIAERRDRLAGTVDELVARAHPRAIAQRSVDDAKQRFVAATRTEDGALRTQRVAAVAGSTVVVLGLMVWNRRRLARRRARR